jgi:hypothetical protein
LPERPCIFRPIVINKDMKIVARRGVITMIDLLLYSDITTLLCCVSIYRDATSG